MILIVATTKGYKVVNKNITHENQSTELLLQRVFLEEQRGWTFLGSEYISGTINENYLDEFQNPAAVICCSGLATNCKPLNFN